MIFAMILMACQDKTVGLEDSGTGASDSGADTSTDSGADSGTDSGTDTDTGEPLGPLTLSSPDLISSEGHPDAARCPYRLPAAFSCDNPNPALVWENVPPEAVGLVLIFDDPDAGEYPHWAVLNLPAGDGGLAAGVSGYGVESDLPAGAEELENGGGWVGYFGSCPGSTHVYRWRIWAVDAALEAPTGRNPSRTFAQLAEDAEAHALASAEMCHLFDPDEPI